MSRANLYLTVILASLAVILTISVYGCGYRAAVDDVNDGRLVIER